MKMKMENELIVNFQREITFWQERIAEEVKAQRATSQKQIANLKALIKINRALIREIRREL
jgi:hypothetical protein